MPKLVTKLRKGAKVKCIDNVGCEGKLTINRVYVISYDQSDDYLDFIGLNGGYRSNRFVVLCPCGLDKCITRHNKDQ